MKVLSRILSVILMAGIVFNANAQNRNKLQESQRAQFDLNNYYISMNVNELLTAYTSRIEYQMDSLMEIESSPEFRTRQLFLKSTLINTISQTAFHSDPLAAAIDSWAMCYQLADYFDTSDCAAEYGIACPVMQNLFLNYASRYETGLSDHISEEDQNGLRLFSQQYPIIDNYLTRRSIIYEISSYISNEQLRLKTGLINMNALVRDVSNQLEYYSAMLPKQTMWEMDMRMGEFIRPDSMALLMHDMRRTLNATAGLLEKSEELLKYNRDTLLANVDYQRRLTMSSISNERIEALSAISTEREAVLNSLRNERMEVQQFMSEQRELLSRDMTAMTGGMLDQTEGIGKGLVDYVFYRVLILTGILVLMVFAGIWFLKR
ncbi:MAG: hypothetical protein P8X57_05020 [Cyclobacteriaceae bacterium]